MKNISLYLISLFTMLAFSACNEDFKDWAAPQINDPEAAENLAFTIEETGLDYILGAINPNAYIAKQLSLSNAEGTTVSYEVQFDKTTDFSTKVTCPLELVQDNMFKVTDADLQSTVETLYGKRPVKRDLFFRVIAFVKTLEGQVSRVQSSGDFSIKVTPSAPLIESAYYLIGNMNGWADNDASKLIKLNQSGKDVYEDPVFSIVLEVPEACYWKVIPQSRVDALNSGSATNVWGDGVLGCAIDGDTSEEGKLITDNPQAIQIEDAGWVKITLNMMEYTYKVEFLGEVSPYMYVAGDHQDWAPATAPIVFTSDFMNYSGFINLNNSFKLCSERSWDGTNYGAAGGEGILSTAPDAGNLTVATPGLYYLTANTSTLSWKAALIQTMGLIGDATANGWDASTPMTYNAVAVEYTVVTTLKSGGFKFRANNGWDINLGGTLGQLAFNGDNISFNGAEGTYKVTLSLANADHWTATLEKQ